MAVDPNVKLYTPAQVAEILHLSQGYIYDLVRSKRITAYVHWRGKMKRLYITAPDLHEFMFKDWLIGYEEDKKRRAIPNTNKTNGISEQLPS